MGQSPSNDAFLLDEEPVKPSLKGGSWPSATPGGSKASEAHRLLQSLEEQLADPKSARAVGDAYRALFQWWQRNQWDSNLQQVLEVLASESMYPTWRRQALEEAYRLFYDEVALKGDQQTLAELPEPPTSEDIGFRQLSEALVAPGATSRPFVRGVFEDRSACMIYQQRWEYSITRASDTGRVAAGREIQGTGHSRQTCICAGDILGQVLQVIVPVDTCCARREDPRAARGPFFLPQGRRGASTLPIPEEVPPPFPALAAAAEGLPT